jgi:hypothetical protein
VAMRELCSGCYTANTTDLAPDVVVSVIIVVPAADESLGELGEDPNTVRAAKIGLFW